MPGENPEPPAEAAPEIPKDAVKLIFLDVDGVICCNGVGRLEEDKLQRIKHVVQQTDAKVVLSTDWRRDASLKATITGALETRGISVIGATRKGAPLKPIRPQEITGWLDAYSQKRTVSEWVAVDDRELIMEMGGERLRGHFVNTSFASGLTDRLAERMIAVLNGEHEQGMGGAFVRAEMQRAANRAAGGRGRGRTPSPGRRAAAAPAAEGAASAPAAEKPKAGGGFAAAVATLPGGSRSSVPAGATTPSSDGSSTPSRFGGNTTPGGLRAGGPRGNASPSRGPRVGNPYAGHGNASPASQKARASAFGAAPAGLMSPTCARATAGEHQPRFGAKPSTPGAGGARGKAPAAAEPQPPAAAAEEAAAA